MPKAKEPAWSDVALLCDGVHALHTTVVKFLEGNANLTDLKLHLFEDWEQRTLDELNAWTTLTVQA